MRERGQSPRGKNFPSGKEMCRPRAEVGDSIIARYAEGGERDKIATLVRVIETQAP